MPEPLKDLEFTVPHLPPRELMPNRAKPGPQWTIRAWYGRQARFRDEYGRMVFVCALEAMGRGSWKPLPQVCLTLTFINPSSKGKKDLDNLVAAFKCGIDAIVKAGVIVGDGPDCVREIVTRAEITREHPLGAVLVRVEKWTEKEHDDIQTPIS